MWFKIGQRGCRVLMIDNFSYNRNRQTEDKTYWICARKVRIRYHRLSCCDPDIFPISMKLISRQLFSRAA